MLARFTTSKAARRWTMSARSRSILPCTSSLIESIAGPSSPIAPSNNSTTKRWHGGPHVSDDAPSISVTFVLPDGETKRTVDGKIGETFLQVAHRHELDLEGACEGVCACSTCHLIFSPEIFDTLEEASEEEEDMLDMAFGLTETSRLGCQVNLTQDMDGMTIEMPQATRNFYVDGHRPQPH